MGIVSAIAGLGSAFLGYRSAKKNAAATQQASQQAAQSARLGFDYLSGNANINQAQAQGRRAGGLYSALIGTGGNTQAADAAFQKYLDSTGYQFQFDQGQRALTGSAAAGGLLNSGATAKALTQYGQNIASTNFGQYLDRLRGQQLTGLNAAQAVGSAGSSAGATAGGFIQQGAQTAAGYRTAGTQEIASGLGTAVGGISDYVKWNNPGLYTSLGGSYGGF